MSFPRGSSTQSFPRVRPSGNRQTGPVLAVGRRVVVIGAGGTSGKVTLTDKDGTTATASVAAGVEVEILAWQPFGLGGTRYRVLASKDGAEGWLGAASVKPCDLPPPLEISAPSSAAGRIQVPERPRAALPPAMARTAPGSRGIPLKIGKRPVKVARKKGS